MFAQNAQDQSQVLTGNGNDRILGGKTYIHILQSILRLRLICAHGKDLLGPDDLSLLQGMTADDAIDLDSDEDENKPPLEESKAYELLDLMRETNNDNCIKCARKLGSKDDSESETDRQEEAREGKDAVLGFMTPCFHAYCPRCVDSFRDDVAGVDCASNAYGHCPVCNSHVKFSVVKLCAGRADVEHETRPHGKGPVKGMGGKIIKARQLRRPAHQDARLGRGPDGAQAAERGQPGRAAVQVRRLLGLDVAPRPHPARPRPGRHHVRAPRRQDDARGQRRRRWTRSATTRACRSCSCPSLRAAWASTSRAPTACT